MKIFLKKIVNKGRRQVRFSKLPLDVPVPIGEKTIPHAIVDSKKKPGR